MMSRIRLYLTFDAEWILNLSDDMIIQEVIEDGLQIYGEECILFDYTDGVVIFEVISERDSELLEDILFETLIDGFPSLHSTDFEIEIDLDVYFD